MNKKLKLRRIKWGIFILLCFVASGLTYSAYATQVAKVNDVSDHETNSSSAEVADGGEFCTKYKGTCEKSNIIDLYDPQITSAYNEATGQEDISIKINKTTTASSFYYIIAYYEKGVTGYTVLKDGYLTNTDNQIVYSVPTYKAANVEVVLALESSEASSAKCTATTNFEIYPHANQQAAIDEYLNSLDTQNPVVDKIDNKKCRYALFLTAGVSIEPVEVPSEENESLKEGGLCRSFIDGTCNAFDSIEGIESTANLKSRCEKYNPANGTEVTSVGSAKMNAYYKDAVAYCYNNTVDVNYSDKDVATMISNAITSYVVDNADYTATTLKKPEGFTDKTGTDLTKTTIELTCALDKVSSTYANTQTDYEYQKEEEKKYYYVEKDKEDSTTIKSTTGKEYTCEKTCQEEVTVKYGPPVAVKAGLCFEYQVKIESKVTCNSKFTGGSKPKKSDYTYCTPTPHCNDSSKYYDQAGPSEEFDSCVSECDGGKYTQSCIDKCYSKVYGTATALDVNYTEKVAAKQISDNKLYNKSAYSVSSSDADVKELMKAVKNNDNCKYKKNKTTGEIEWKCTKTAQGWETYGRYYFQTLSKAKETIKEDLVSGKGQGEIRCLSSGNCRRWYYEGVSGIKRACENANCTKHCEESCEWVGCKEATYLNPTDALDAYNADLEAYNDAKSGCSSSTSCNTTQTTYTIKVNNKVKSGATLNNTTYKATVENKNWTDNNNIIIDNGFCYNNTSTNTKQYMTEWSVPSSWINNKTGEISYKTPKDSDAWTEKENQFCTSLSSDNVNEKWWNWRVKNTGTVTKDDIDWNIIATANDFGKFNWNFKISCFYAAYDDPIETCEDPPCDSSCTTPPCETEETLSYRVRSVDSSDLFPSPDSTDKKTYSYLESGRDPGFNWSNAATDLRNPKYEITPGALMQTIQQRSTQIYEGKEFLDYEFELDRETLMKLASTKFNYNQFSGTTSIENKITVYKSNLIRDITNKTVPAVLGCNNRKDSANCETFNNTYVDTLR